MHYCENEVIHTSPVLITLIWTLFLTSISVIPQVKQVNALLWNHLIHNNQGFT